MSTQTEVNTPPLTLESITAMEDVVFPRVSQKQLAWRDMKEGIAKWRIWVMLAYQDIKLRYRRSVLGPFWLTISMAITVYSMGYLYSHLFHMSLQLYFPFVVSGMLSWSLISTIVIEFTDGLINSDIMIKQIKLPYTIYMHRIATRNIIIFFHNLLVMVPVFIIYHDTARINLHSLLFIPGLLMIYLNAIFYGIIISMLGARYRDVSQMIKSLIQVVFFITPVMWDPSILNPTQRYIVDLNPFYAFLELIRAPLLGNLPTLKNLMMVTLVSFLGILLSATMFTRFRSRIVYWL